MEKDKVMRKLKNYKKAVNRLKEAVEEENVNQYVYDSIIQRFEFTYELSWKLLKSFLEYKGIQDVKFPKDVLKEAFVTDLIDNNDSEVWIQMQKDRNLTSHTYDEEDAKLICQRVKDKYFEVLQKLVDVLEGELSK